MQLAGEIEIAAPRQRVWETLTDPRQVAACVPGQPEVEVIDAQHLRVKAPVGNSWLRTTVVVDIELSDLEPPERVSATASGSVMGGSVKASGRLELEELGPALTRVVWSSDLTLGGMLAGFASMAEGPARDGVNQTLACLKARIEAESGAADAGTPEVTGSD
jgi:carbon monoxide dehydrogenase subunit G